VGSNPSRRATINLFDSWNQTVTVETESSFGAILKVAVSDGYQEKFSIYKRRILKFYPDTSFL